jgi:hypothetical protein
LNLHQRLTTARPIAPPHAAERLIDHIVGVVRSAHVVDPPFRHLEFEQVFPADVYASMLRAMPDAADYRPMSGRTARTTSRQQPTRVKVDLFPEYIRHFAPEKREIWTLVGRALCSRQLQAAFVERLAPNLEARFGARYADVGLFPIPILTRDIPGYSIGPHTDTHWKAITVQLYLPRDDSTAHIGTIFHEQLPDGSHKKISQVRFAPNSGYAFAVGENTWHSADPVGPEVETRDSILLTYFDDAGAWRYLRNRGKRLGNLVRNELRYLTRS